MPQSSPYCSIGRYPGKIPELDGLRGLAILLVFLRHAAYPIYEDHGEILSVGDWDLAIPLLNGWMGVDLFFVLSGFLITHHLIRRWPGKFNRSFAGRYWLKRVLRTFPAYYAAVLIALFALVPFFDPDVDDRRSSLTIHFLFLQDYLGSDLVAAFWSLGVEEKFYLLCPAVLLALRNVSTTCRFQILVFLALLPATLRLFIALGSTAELINYPAFFWTVRSPFHLAMDGLWVGVICALVYKDKETLLKNRDTLARWMSLVSLAVIFVLMFSFAWFDHLHFIASTLVLNAISISFGGLLISVCIGRTPVSGVLKSRWLRILSVLSYSIYLMHLMFVPWALEVTSAMFGEMENGPFLNFLVFLPVFALMSLAGGMLLHFSVEKPFLILKDRVRI